MLRYGFWLRCLRNLAKDVFSEFLNLVIDGRHGGYHKGAKHITDLDSSKLNGGDDLDPEYVLSCRVRTGRSIRGICLPPHCTRAERRHVEKIVSNVLNSFDGEFEGKTFIMNTRYLICKILINPITNNMTNFVAYYAISIIHAKDIHIKMKANELTV